MMKCLIGVAIILALSAIAKGQGHQATVIDSRQLRVGDKAPTLSIHWWIKGSPVLAFKRNNIYVIEFGATWCGPCRAHIPHLKELANKYKDRITVVNVYIWENGQLPSADSSYIRRIRNIVQNLNEGALYSVGIDGPLQNTALNWMTAAQLTAVPKSFIVDQNGIITWIGEPDELDAVLEKVVAGKFNSPEQAQGQKLQNELINQKLTLIWTWRNDGKFGKAVNSLDSLINAYPGKHWLYFEKFRLAMDRDSVMVKKLVLHMMGIKEFEPFLLHIAQEMAFSKQPDLDLVIRVADRALANKPPATESAFLLDAKARVFVKRKQFKTAIELEQKAIEILKDEAALSNSASLQFDIKAFQNRMDRFKELMYK